MERGGIELGEGQRQHLAQWASTTQELHSLIPSSGSLGTPEVVTIQPVSGKGYAVGGWCHANPASGQSPELTGRSINREPGDQL